MHCRQDNNNHIKSVIKKKHFHAILGFIDDGIIYLQSQLERLILTFAWFLNIFAKNKSLICFNAILFLYS